VRRRILWHLYCGPNYGVVFTAYGAEAIIENLLAGQLKIWSEATSRPFYPVALLAIAGIVISFVLIRNRARRVVRVDGRSPPSLKFL